MSLTTPVVGLAATDQCGEGKSGLRRGFLWHVDRPESTADRQDVLGGLDLFEPQELRPGAIWRVGEVVGRPFSISMPPGSRLIRRLPQKGEPRIGVAEEDHVAGAERSERARSRTLLGPGSVGRHSWRVRISAGDRFSSSVRLRSNQRRIPMSL